MSLQQDPGDWDEFDEYLAEAMEDPAFRLAYERAGRVGVPWRRWLKRVLRAAWIALAWTAFLVSAAIMLAGTGVIHVGRGG